METKLIEELLSKLIVSPGSFPEHYTLFLEEENPTFEQEKMNASYLNLTTYETVSQIRWLRSIPTSQQDIEDSENKLNEDGKQLQEINGELARCSDALNDEHIQTPVFCVDVILDDQIIKLSPSVDKLEHKMGSIEGIESRHDSRHRIEIPHDARQSHVCSERRANRMISGVDKKNKEIRKLLTKYTIAWSTSTSQELMTTI
ncbi:hypothetical protein GJ496_002974 [Pomphorhynchus laevis]|nr:hypothetical protein GJ496_002974 [Pomphorhynchus laevis]